MLGSSRQFVAGLLLFLAAGALIGWMYDAALIGFLGAAFLALIWQVRQLLLFDRAMHTGDFDAFRVGEGIWQQMFSRFTHEHERGSRYKQLHRQVLKEIRKSTIYFSYEHFGPGRIFQNSVEGRHRSCLS